MLYDCSALWCCTEAKRIRTKIYSGLWNQLCLNTSIHLIAWGEEARSLSAVTERWFRCSSHDKALAQGCQQCWSFWLQEEVNKQEVGGPSISRKCNTKLCASPNYSRIDEFTLHYGQLPPLKYAWSFLCPSDLRVYSMWHLAFVPVKTLSAYRRRMGILLARP